MEGLYRPRDIATPFPVHEVVSCLVKISVPIYFHVTVLEDQKAVNRLRLPFERRRFFLDEGVVLWQVVLSVEELGGLRGGLSPDSSTEMKGETLQPGTYEILHKLSEAEDFPTFEIVRMEGHAGGVVVDEQGSILTCYHVAREEIVPKGLRDGGQHPVDCDFLRVWRRQEHQTECEVDEWIAVRNVKLLANMSHDQWKEGKDAALLSMEGPARHIQLAAGPPKMNDELWVFGFPIRSARNPERMRNLGYDDADTTLRIARGRVIERPNDYNFVVDADGLSGNSGGPVVNERGELVGIVHDVYPREEGRRRPCQFGGGLICVSAHSALAWLT